jgi:hypothetical protein
VGQNYWGSDNTRYSIANGAIDKIYFSAGKRRFVGRVASDGTLVSGCDADRAGWTVSKTGTGTYEVTHDFGSNVYYVLACLDNAGVGQIGVSRSTNTFTVNTNNSSGTATDAAFMFELALPDNNVTTIVAGQ